MDFFCFLHEEQKISQETSIKVQLQIVLHDGKSSKFHFANREGPPAQTRDRAVVKELLQQLLPKFRHMVNKELEEKNRILQDDPELFQLYKDLVISKVMTADEFWANRKSMVRGVLQFLSKDIRLTNFNLPL